MRTAMIVLTALLFSAIGQNLQADDATKRALAEELLNEMHMKENMEKSLDMMKKAMPQWMKTARASAKTALPPGEETPETKEAQEKAEQAATKMMDEMSKQMTWDSMKGDFIALYAETFTEEELKGLVDFYKTPVGQSFVKKQPELMKRSMQLSQAKMMKWMPKMQELMKGMKEPVEPVKPMVPSPAK